MTKKSTKAPSDVKILRIGATALAALRTLAESNLDVAKLLPTSKRQSGGGVERRFAEAVFRNPDITIDELRKLFPTLDEPRGKYLRRSALNYKAAAEATGRWNANPVAKSAAVQPEAETRPEDDATVPAVEVHSEATPATALPETHSKVQPIKGRKAA